VVSSTPRSHFTPGKGPVRILQEAGWAPGSVWTGGKSRPHRDSIPDRPARSLSLYRLSYPPPHIHTHTHTQYATSELDRFERSASRPGRFNSNQTDSLDRKRCGSQPLRSSWGKKHILFVRRKRNHNRPVRNQTLYCVSYLAFVGIKNFDLSRSYLTLNMMFQTIKFIDKLLLVSDSDIP